MPSKEQKLRSSLFLLALLTILLPSAIISQIFITYHKHATIDDTNKENIVLATAIRNDISNFLRLPQEILSITMLHASDMGHQSMTSRLLTITEMESRHFESILILDAKGVVTDAGTSGKAHDRQEPLFTDMSHRPEFIEAVRTNRTTWSDTFISPLTNMPTVNLVLPLKGQFIMGTLNLTHISQTLEKAMLPGVDNLYIVNAKGRLVASRDMGPVLRQESLSHLDIVNRGLAGFEGVAEYRSARGYQLGAILKIPETGWHIVVEKDRQGALKHLAKMQRGLYAANISIMALIFLFTLYINRRMIKPVLEVADATNSIASGHLAEHDFNPSPYYEITLLQKNFNHMASSLKERNRALRTHQEELLRERSLNEAIMDGIPGLLYLYDSKWRLIRWNRKHEEFTGFTQEELQGKFILDWFAEDRKKIMDDFFKNAAKGVDQVFEADMLCKDGSTLPMLLTGVPLLLDGQNCLVGIGIDITGRKEIEQYLFQQQKLEGVGMLAGGVAHDINNLLTPVFISIEMLQRKTGQDFPGEKHIRTIMEASVRIKDLVAKLLAFGRKQPQTLLLTDLNALIAGFMGIMKRTIRENILIKVKPSDTPCIVKADAGQLEQVLLNLAVNSQDAIKANGTITIETGRTCLDEDYCRNIPHLAPGRFVYLSLSDNGCGMDEATQSKVFEPFFTTKPQGKGTGLGLSTVYGIIHQLSGQIELTSEPAVGTTVRILLPEHCNADTQATPQPSVFQEKTATARGTILLLEDNDDLRESLKESLSDFGFKILSTSSPHAAIRLAMNNRDTISFLLSDVVMPGMNGPEAYREIARIIPGLPVLFMSGYASDTDQYPEIRDNPELLITKPFSTSQLLERINIL